MNLSLSDMYERYTLIAVRVPYSSNPFIRPEHTNLLTFRDGFFNRICQTVIFSKEYFEKGEDLFSSLNKIGARKIKSCIFIKIVGQKGEFPFIKRGNNNSGYLPVLIACNHLNSH